MKTKNNLGQFYTTNANYIVGKLISYLPKDGKVCDPFAGNWDLLNILPKSNEVIAYDIVPQNKSTIAQNTLLEPPQYDDIWIITNPPYLAKNKNNAKTNTNKFKNSNKKLYDKYQLNDLYKIALKTFNSANGGIIIVPLNFFCEEDYSIRKEFLQNFRIKQLNIFEEKVFDDTSYTVCSFFFEKSNKIISQQSIPITFFPSEKITNLMVDEKNNFRLGSAFYDLINIESNVEITRLCKGDAPNSHIKLRAIDTGTQEGRIKLEYVEEPYFDNTPNRTERCFASLNFSIKLSKKKQLFIIEQFNNLLETNREKYNSLFLTNFRNSTASYARKRISFETAFKIIKYIIETNRDIFL